VALISSHPSDPATSLSAASMSLSRQHPPTQKDHPRAMYNFCNRLAIKSPLFGYGCRTCSQTRKRPPGFRRRYNPSIVARWLGTWGVKSRISSVLCERLGIQRISVTTPSISGARSFWIELTPQRTRMHTTVSKTDSCPSWNKFRLASSGIRLSASPPAVMISYFP